jgi:hypothetical protein
MNCELKILNIQDDYVVTKHDTILKIIQILYMIDKN